MKVRIIAEFELENLFNLRNLKNRIKQQFHNWKRQFDLKNFKIEF